MKQYKVIQWGAGFAGAFSLRYILSNPALQLVGVKCHTEEKQGMDAGTIAGVSPCGVLATREASDLLSLQADCVIFMPRDPLVDPSVPESPSRVWVQDMIAILESGKNVITSICSGTHWRHLARGEAFHAELEAACRKGNASVFFTGFDPGFSTDALAFALSSVVGEIRKISSWEILDYSHYSAPETLKAMGYGARPESLSPESMGVVTTMWGGALHLMADCFGVQIENITVTPDLYLSPRTFTAPGGLLVEQGTIGALRFTVSGIVHGRPVFEINHVTRIGQDMAPDWPKVGRDGGYRIEIDSFPPFAGEFPMGLPGGTGLSFSDAMAMTAARCVNSVEAVVEAQAGYRTLLNLKPLGGKYAIAR